MPLLDRLRQVLGHPADAGLPQDLQGLAAVVGGAAGVAGAPDPAVEATQRPSAAEDAGARLARRSPGPAEAVGPRTDPGGRDAARAAALASPAAAWAGAGPREVASAKAVADASDG